MTATAMSVPTSLPKADVSGFSRDRALWGAIMLAPYVLVFAVMVAYPVIYGFWLGLNWNSYRQLFADPIFLRTIVNTILFLFIAVNLKFLIALWLSGFFVSQRGWVRIVLVLFILPWAVPSIPTILSFRWFLNSEWGMLNNLLFQWFEIMEPPAWLLTRWSGLTMICIVHIWKYLPFWTLILLAGRLAISKDLYESADVDGATGLQKFRYVTFPSLRNLYITSTLLSTIMSLGDFNSIYLLTGGGPGDLTQTLATLGIRYAFGMSEVEAGVSTVVIALPIMLPLLIIMLRRMAKGDKS